MTQLSVYFVDLIAYVPYEEGKEVTVLMPATPPMEAHTPYLKFPFANYVAGDQGLDCGKGVRAWQLAGEELTIAGAPNSSLTMDLTSTSGLPDAFSVGFGWVTPAADLHPNNPGKVRSEALGPQAHSLVTARMKLTHGTLEAYHFSTVEDKNNTSQSKMHGYVFKEDANQSQLVERALVNAVVWKVPFPETQPQTLTIEARDFNGNITRHLTLNASPSPPILVFGNLSGSSAGYPKNMRHFAYFYNLIEGWDSGLKPHYLPVRGSNQTGPIGRPLPPHVGNLIIDFEYIQLDKEACPHIRLEPTDSE